MQTTPWIDATVSCFSLKQLCGPNIEQFYENVCKNDSSYATCLYQAYPASFNEDNTASDVYVGVCDTKGFFLLMEMLSQRRSIFHLTITQHSLAKGMREFDEPMEYEQREVLANGVTTRWKQFQFLPKKGLLFAHIHSNKIHYTSLPKGDLDDTIEQADNKDEYQQVYIVGNSEGSILSLELSPSGQFVAYSSEKGELIVFELKQPNDKTIPPCTRTVNNFSENKNDKWDKLTCMKFISDSLLVISGTKGKLFVYDTNRGLIVKELLIEDSIVQKMYMIRYQGTQFCKLLLINSLETLYVWDINITLDSEWISLSQTIYTSSADQQSEVTCIYAFQHPNSLISKVGELTVLPIEGIEQEVARRYRDTILIICKKGTQNSMELYRSDGNLLLKYGPFEHTVLYCSLLVEKNENNQRQQRLTVCLANGKGYMWSIDSILEDMYQQDVVYENEKTIQEEARAYVGQEALEFVDCSSSGNSSIQQEETAIEIMKEENETVKETETMESEISFQDSIYSDEENPRPQLILKEVKHEEPQINDQTDLREFTMLPIPQPYPTKDKESITKSKAEKKVMIIRHSGPPFEKPTMNLNLNEDHAREPKYFNYGNAEEISQMTRDYLPKEPTAQNYEDFHPTLNSTRLIQEKLHEIEKEEFTLPEGISELPRDEADKANKILNYSSSDRIFHNLPVIEEMGEKEKDKAMLKKKKVKKGVNQKYLDRLAKSRSLAKLPQKTDQIEEETEIRNVYLWKSDVYKPPSYNSRTDTMFITQYLLKHKYF